MACGREEVRIREYERSHLANHRFKMAKYTEISDDSTHIHYTMVNYRRDSIMDEIIITKEGRTTIYANEISDTLPETEFRKLWKKENTKITSNDSINKLVEEIKQNYKLN